MKRIMYPLFKLPIFGLFLLSSHAIAQEALLELPGLEYGNQKSNDSQNLELLSPNEIDNLYNNNTSPTNIPPINDGDSTAPRINPQNPLAAEPSAVPVPITPDVPALDNNASYSSLMNELENEENDNFSGDDEIDINQLWSGKSFMLSPQEVSVFNSALRRYQKSLEEPEIEVVETQEEVETVLPSDATYYPLIAIDSIMYINPSQWSVWINRKKYSPKSLETLPGISVTGVTKNTVSLKWNHHAYPKTENAEAAEQESSFFASNNVQQTTPPVITNPNALSRTEKEQMVKPYIQHIENTAYRVTLSANQALATDDFTLIEGRVVNAKIREIYQFNNTVQQQQGTTTARILEPVSPEKIEEMKTEQDINQLLELYKGSGGNTSSNE